MCANYRPVTRMDRMLTFFGVERLQGDFAEAEAWPSALVPFIRLKPASEGLAPNERLVLDAAIWRVVPDFVTAQVWAKNTFNARSEELMQKSTYRPLWKAGQRCIIPAEWFFEPRYFGTVEKPGKSERWRIQKVGGVPLGIAGIYRRFVDEKTGEITHTMGMLTCNADTHPVMQQFHRPGDEKRMPVILDPEQYMEWLTCTPDEAQLLCKQWHGPLEAFADAAAPRRRKAEPPDGGQEPML